MAAVVAFQGPSRVKSLLHRCYLDSHIRSSSDIPLMLSHVGVDEKSLQGLDEPCVELISWDQYCQAISKLWARHSYHRTGGASGRCIEEDLLHQRRLNLSRILAHLGARLELWLFIIPGKKLWSSNAVRLTRRRTCRNAGLYDLAYKWEEVRPPNYEL